MLNTFSKRNGYLPHPSIVLDNLPISCINRLWNKLDDFFTQENDNVITLAAIINAILDGIGEVKFSIPSEWREGQNKIKKHWFNSWYHVFDILELFLNFVYTIDYELSTNAVCITKEFNRILEEENSAYRFLKTKAVKIANAAELESLSESMHTNYDSVNIAMKKAAKHYSDSPADYENSIKESISAVEAMCNCITGEKTTLNKTLAHLQEHNCSIHPALQEAFIKLYGYASDASGIRHAKKTDQILQKQKQKQNIC